MFISFLKTQFVVMSSQVQPGTDFSCNYVLCMRLALIADTSQLAELPNYTVSALTLS